MAAFAFASLLSTALGTPLHPRLDDGLALTPQMGWNTYNQYNCFPNESIVHENAQALVDTGLADLGYRYVTVDCGWSVEDRLPDGTLTWNETLFPQGFPALGRYLHDLGLLFGAYGDSGILLCGSPPNQAGSLYHEDIDARTFAEWEVDSLKYDNCYSDATENYPNVNYSPSHSPRPRFANMSHYIQLQDRPMLFQICEWGIDFPALWAPALGHSWRIGNDITPHWRSIFRTLNQAVPQVDFAGRGQWPDLDMLLVGVGVDGEGVLSLPEERTHFSMWAVLKSPLVIGGAINGMEEGSLEILKNEDVIAFNQDALGESARLRRRWSDAGYEVWSGPLERERVVAAVINWGEEERELTLDLPDVGIQFAGGLRNIWRGEAEDDVLTSYTASVEGHGVMLVELSETVPAGEYPSEIFAKKHGASTTFSHVYAVTSSRGYTLNITFSEPPTAKKISIATDATTSPVTVSVPSGASSVTARIPLTAGSDNTITIHGAPVSSIHLTPPKPTYYPATRNTTLTGSTTPFTCPADFCSPTGSKLTHLDGDSTAKFHISSTASGAKYLEVDYINNEVAFDSSWGWGSNSRNLTVRVNDEEPVRLEVPLSGRHSELFGPGLGWWDSGRLGVLTGGWRVGGNEVVFGNEGGEGGFSSSAPDLVGFGVYD
ncbi:alpha-galactosidase D [Aspergillus lucknowensis]|uniref:Alpha-galactosidase n=1 Tax=Aspergillus lucknowensis TaxID=176173 RepID=A0ABR4LS16_9EURO